MGHRFDVTTINAYDRAGGRAGWICRASYRSDSGLVISVGRWGHLIAVARSVALDDLNNALAYSSAALRDVYGTST